MSNMFKENLKYFRKRSKLTQEELAKKLNIARSTITAYECGVREPDFETLEAIADFFNVNMSTLLGEDLDKDVVYMTEDDKVLFQTLRGYSQEDIEQALKILEALRK